MIKNYENRLSKLETSTGIAGYVAIGFAHLKEDGSYSLTVGVWNGKSGSQSKTKDHEFIGASADEVANRAENFISTIPMVRGSKLIIYSGEEDLLDE